jgi:hypothetical protein
MSALEEGIHICACAQIVQSCCESDVLCTQLSFMLNVEA